MFATLHQLKETKDFISNVDHYVEKMKNQQKQIDELEAYLVKYGYQPLPKAAVLPEQKQCADKDKADEVDNGEDLGSMAEKYPLLRVCIMSGTPSNFLPLFFTKMKTMQGKSSRIVPWQAP